MISQSEIQSPFKIINNFTKRTTLDEQTKKLVNQVRMQQLIFEKQKSAKKEIVSL